MISWATILYGAALSAILAGAAFAVALRLTRPVVVLTGAIAAAAGPVAWNAILRAVDASEFFVDAPISLFPVSWQDTGSGIFTLAASCLALGLGPLRNDPGQHVARYGLLAALAALLVDVYLY